MHQHVRQQSKTRILLQLIEQYNQSSQDKALLHVSKQNSIAQIEKRFNKSETNRTYVFPRIKEPEPESDLHRETQSFKTDEPQRHNFKDFLKKIYVSNQKKGQNTIKQELTRKQYSIFSSRRPLNKTQNLRLHQSSSQTKLLTDTTIKQASGKQSRGNSPENKPYATSRSISTQQLMKFVNQKKKEIQEFNTCRSFELRAKFNISPQLLQNKSLDFSKQFNKLK